MLETISDLILSNQVIFWVILILVALVLGAKIMFRVAEASFYVVGIFAFLKYLIA